MHVLSQKLKANSVGVRRRQLDRFSLSNPVPLRRRGAQLVRAVGKPQQHSAPLKIEPTKACPLFITAVSTIHKAFNFDMSVKQQSLSDKMSSLYTQSVPVLIKYLNNLAGIVKKGELFADEKGVKHEEVIGFRLVADMRG